MFEQFLSLIEYRNPKHVQYHVVSVELQELTTVVGSFTLKEVDGAMMKITVLAEVEPALALPTSGLPQPHLRVFCLTANNPTLTSTTGTLPMSSTVMVPLLLEMCEYRDST